MTNNTTHWMKRLAAGAALTAAPALFALGAAGVSHADTTSGANTGPNLSQPAIHQSFPGEDITEDMYGGGDFRHHFFHHGFRHGFHHGRHHS